MNIYCHCHYLSSELLPSPPKRSLVQNNLQVVNNDSETSLKCSCLSLSLFLFVFITFHWTLRHHKAVCDCLYLTDWFFTPLPLPICLLCMEWPFYNFIQKVFIKPYCSLPNDPLPQSSNIIFLVAFYSYSSILFYSYQILYLYLCRSSVHTL